MWPDDLMAYLGDRVDFTRPINEGLKQLGQGVYKTYCIELDILIS